MAWLQNLAGKAEDFLNKIDQNAATVLNESNVKDPDTLKINIQPLNVIEPLEYVDADNGFDNTLLTLNDSPVVCEENFVKDNISNISDKSKSTENDNGGIFVSLNNNSRESTSPFENVPSVKIFEKEYTGLSSISESMQNCSPLPEEQQIKYEERIGNLELQNQDLNKQLLNLQHLYREIQNENVNIQTQVDRSNESVKQAREEMEQYKARAQRVLQEREKLFALKKDPTVSRHDLDATVIHTYNEELKKEAEFHQEKNRDLTEKLHSLSKDWETLQHQYFLIQNTNEEGKQTLLNNLVQEKKYRSVAEEECRIKTKELQAAFLNLSDQQTLIKRQYQNIKELKDQLKHRNQLNSNADVEARLLSLTQTLMTKQSNLETITTERNALRIQLEKIETEYMKLLQSKNSQVSISNVDDPNEGKSMIPKLMVVSPFDAGMTRRVKQTYSTLDALSVRTGVFLRRYPLARIFVFCYMVLLHMWVLIILCTYIPNSR